MSVPFRPQQGLVMVHAAVEGPSGSAVLQPLLKRLDDSGFIDQPSKR